MRRFFSLSAQDASEDASPGVTHLCPSTRPRSRVRLRRSAWAFCLTASHHPHSPTCTGEYRRLSDGSIVDSKKTAPSGSGPLQAHLRVCEKTRGICKIRGGSFVVCPSGHIRKVPSWRCQVSSHGFSALTSHFKLHTLDFSKITPYAVTTNHASHLGADTRRLPTPWRSGNLHKYRFEAGVVGGCRWGPGRLHCGGVVKWFCGRTVAGLRRPFL